jgi:5'-methylthioadenosine phosphorylase
MMLQGDLLILLAVLLPPAALDGLGQLVEERTVPTPYGAVGPFALRLASSAPPAGAGRPVGPGAGVWIQPYTGASNRTDPRATLYAARALGVRQIVNWDQGVAVNPVLQRGHVAIVADYVDFTRQPYTFGGGLPGSFGGGLPAAMPWEEAVHRPAFCPRIGAILRAALPFAVDVVYLGVDGPRRETPAEARIYRQWGVDVVGQNLVPEVALAQEAGLCYAGLVTVADVSADRPAAAPKGELRAALGAVLATLPRVMVDAAAPGECDCAGQRAPV